MRSPERNVSLRPSRAYSPERNVTTPAYSPDRNALQPTCHGPCTVTAHDPPALLQVGRPTWSDAPPSRAPDGGPHPPRSRRCHACAQPSTPAAAACRARRAQVRLGRVVGAPGQGRRCNGTPSVAAPSAARRPGGSLGLTSQPAPRLGFKLEIRVRAQPPIGISTLWRQVCDKMRSTAPASPSWAVDQMHLTNGHMFSVASPPPPVHPHP